MSGPNENLQLYLALVDQIQKYNSIVWQVPTALVAANLFALDRFADDGFVLVIVSLFNAALIFAFFRLVRQQGVLIDAARGAEAKLAEAHPEYVPRFPKSRVSARWVLLFFLAIADGGLLFFGLRSSGGLSEVLVPQWVSRTGLLLAVAGTVLLAFSVKVKRQYSRDMAEVADRLKSPDMIEPTETYISRQLFWAGLTLVAIGTLLQW